MALGCIGMSLDDFERCTPFEFNAIALKWREDQERHEHTDWERARFIATAVLQPYSKNTLKPTDVVRFPWDEKEQEVPKGTSSRERMQEILRRVRK